MKGSTANPLSFPKPSGRLGTKYALRKYLLNEWLNSYMLTLLFPLVNI